MNRRKHLSTKVNVDDNMIIPGKIRDYRGECKWKYDKQEIYVPVDLDEGENTVKRHEKIEKC